METLDGLLHFTAPKMRKSDQHSYVLLDIKILTFDLKIGPHCTVWVFECVWPKQHTHITLLGHNALLLVILLLLIQF